MSTEPAKFVKKPVEIEAMQFDMFESMSGVSIMEWVMNNGGQVSMTDISEKELDFMPALSIKTLEGTMLAKHGWWIVKGIKGEFYPVEPEIFAATYEKKDK